MGWRKILISVTGLMSVVASYGIYCYSNPGTDGLVFGSVMVLIGGIAGINMTDIVSRLKQGGNIDE